MAIKIEYHGHSCFVISVEGYRIALDPYDGHVPGYAPLELSANEVMCSHEHLDHCYREAVTLTSGGINPFAVEEFVSYHDDAKGTLRGSNTIRIFAWRGIRIAHLGDMGCVPAREIEAALQNLDAVMIPVGGTYTLDACQSNTLIEAIQPKIVIPMHYRCGRYGLELIDFIESFARLRNDVTWYEGNTILIEKKMGRQTAILKYNDPNVWKEI